MQQFFIKKFFNPNGGPAANSEAIKEQADKPQTTADVMKDFPKDQNDEFHYIEAKDKGVTAGKETQVGQLNVVGQNIDKHNEHRGEVQKQVESQIADPKTPESLKQDIQAKVDETQQAKEEVRQHTQDEAGQVLFEYTKEEKYKDVKYKNKIKEGKISDDTIKEMLADLDGDGKVEVENMNWWGQLANVFRDGANQTEMVWERQVLEIIKSRSPEQIQQLYQRITGKELGQVTKENYNEKKEQMKEFQRQLLDRVGNLSIMSKIFFWEGVRFGLASVLNGNEQSVIDRMNAMAQDPEQLAKINQTLAKYPSVQRDGTILRIIGKAAIQIGLNVTLSVASGWLLSFRVQNEEIKTASAEKGAGMGTQTDKKPTEFGEWKLDGSLKNMKAGIDNGKGQWANLDIDLFGAVAEVNFNDHVSILNRAQRVINESPDKIGATQKIINQFNEKILWKEEPKNPSKDYLEKKAKMQELGNKLIEMQNKIMQISAPNDDVKKRQIDALNHNIKIYSAKAMELNGVDFKGLYANASWLWGLALTAWAQANVTDVWYTDKGRNEWSSKIESDLNAQDVSDEKIDQVLAQLGWNKDANGNYIHPETKKPIIVPEGKKLKWDIQNVYEFGKKKQSVKAILVDIKHEADKNIQVAAQNMDAESEFFNKQDISKRVSDMLLKLRWNRWFTDIQRDISDNKYQDSVPKLENFLQWVMNGKTKYKKTAWEIFSELQKVKDDPIASRVFLDKILAKTSGGVNSRRLASELLSGKNIKDGVMKYYREKTPSGMSVSESFAKLYGISDANKVMQLADQITNNLGTTPTSIGSHAKHGFSAMVAYSQRNDGKNTFRQIDRIINVHDKIIGQPVEVTDPEVKQAAKEAMKKQIPESELQAIRDKHPDLKDLSNEQLYDQLLTTVKAYMSFEPDAECFNLGFMLEPGIVTIKWQPIPINSRVREGASVLDTKASVVSGGIAAGVEIGKKEPPKKEPEPKKPAEATHAAGEKVENVEALTPSIGSQDVGREVNTMDSGDVPISTAEVNNVVTERITNHVQALWWSNGDAIKAAEDFRSVANAVTKDWNSMF